MRTDRRKSDELRPITMATGFQAFAEGSALISWGQTRVLCAASVEPTVPAFRERGGGGWLTAEYNMLPRSTSTRKARRQGGRETEIQRLIGRSLRAAFDLNRLGTHTIWVDCDVLQADGGTRVASITGGYVAAALAIAKLQASGAVPLDLRQEPVAAISVGIVDGVPLLDLPYAEDSRAQVDLNLVMTAGGRLIEVQGTAEHAPFSRGELDALLDLGGQAIEKLCALQQRAIEAAGRGQSEVSL